MADVALRNAEYQRNQLLDEKKRLRLRLREIDAYLAQIERFIAEWQAFSEGDFEKAVDKSMPENENRAATTSPKKKKATGNSKKEDVAEASRQIIMELGQPVLRSDLYGLLAGRGYVIQGTDPEMVLSTMLWRMQNRVVRLKTGGYWLPERPWPEAGYDPDLEEFMEATDNREPTA